MTWVAALSARPPVFADDAEAALAAVRARIRAVCRRYDAKTLARMGGVSVKTAESWREGRATPQPDGMARLAAALGREVLDVIYGPVIGEPDLDRRLGAVALQIETLREDVREAGYDTVVLGAARPDARTGAPAGVAPSAARGTPCRVRGVVAPTLLMLAVAMGAALLPLAGADGDPLVRARNPRPVRVARVVGREC